MTLKKQKTLALIKRIATTIETYYVDYGKYPKVAVNALEPMIVPTYIAKLDIIDAWGTPIVYNVGDDSQNYTLISCGSDKICEKEVLGGKMQSYEKDIVLSDGTFKQWPEGLNSQIE